MTSGVAVRIAIPHGDHEHRFDFGADGPWPPEVKVRCSRCRRVVRELSLDHAGSVMIHGEISSALGGGSIQKVDPATGKVLDRRAADCSDASPHGWNADRPPSHYLFVCRHKSGTDLSRPVKVETLLARYLDAVCDGTNTTVLD